MIINELKLLLEDVNNDLKLANKYSNKVLKILTSNDSNNFIDDRNNSNSIILKDVEPKTRIEYKRGKLLYFNIKDNYIGISNLLSSSQFNYNFQEIIQIIKNNIEEQFFITKKQLTEQLIHEYNHWLEHEKSSGKNIPNNYFNKLNVSKNQDEIYYNSTHEFNAYMLQFLKSITNKDKELGIKHILKLLKKFQAGTFYNALNAENKQQAIKKIYNFI